jgi:hypothetical protein
MEMDRFIPKTLKDNNGKTLAFDEMFGIGMFSSNT